jgi:hypothetical protein
VGALVWWLWSRKVDAALAQGGGAKVAGSGCLNLAPEAGRERTRREVDRKLLGRMDYDWRRW